MLDITKYKTIILDCDGVIFDSNSLKIKAFKSTLEAYPQDSVDAFIRYVGKNFGKTRAHFFEYFLQNYTGKEEQALSHLLEVYGVACQKLYLQASLTAYFLDFVEKYFQDREFFVASGSDRKELCEVFKQRNLSQYFEMIYGSPISKKMALEQILSRVDKRTSVMVGDAFLDYEAADFYGIDFIYLWQYSFCQKEMFLLKKEKGFFAIETFKNLM